MKRYSVDVDGKTIIEVYADGIELDKSRIVFFRNHESVAEFAVWRYWKLEGERVK